MMIYFNENETVFLSWELSKGRQYMIKLLNQPFKKKVKSMSSTDLKI